jgi:hypothetical protein
MALEDIPSDGERRRHSELRDAIDRIAEQAAKRAGRRAGRRAAVGYFALLFVLLVGAVAYSHEQERKLHAGLAASCERVNALRVGESNRNAQVLYAAFYSARMRERKLAGAGGGRAGAAHREAVRYLDTSIAALRWTPRTNCQQAVEHPRTYQRPAARPFTPEYLDLSLTPG